MISVVAYSSVAVLIIAVVVLSRARESRRNGQAEGDYLQDFPGGLTLALVERIFDSTDYVWLQDELHFPDLASELAQARKELAIRWLKALKNSFDQLARPAEPLLSGGGTRASLWSCQVFWLTLRFHLLLQYALLTVRLFGPYHRLVPSLAGRLFKLQCGLRGEPFDRVQSAL